jgi:photosystem II stability/assembly factor-like uncharacterized protein
MAIAKYGVFITSLKGKIGGTVMQGGKAGQTVKNKPNFKPQPKAYIAVAFTNPDPIFI